MLFQQVCRRGGLVADKTALPLSQKIFFYRLKVSEWFKFGLHNLCGLFQHRSTLKNVDP